MKKILVIIVLLILFVQPLYSFDIMSLWRHPEIAEKNAIFADIGVTIRLIDPEFNILPFDIRIDYMLPLPLPFSAGLFLVTPNPNLKTFGYRIGYHFDVRDPRLDVFFIYSFDFGFIRNDLLIEYNDTPVTPNYYDFRIGVRRFFGTLGVCVETGFKLESIIFLLSVKIN